MCHHATQIQAFYDGELEADRQRAFQKHLPDCPECRAELEQLRAISRILSAIPLPEVPTAAMSRFRRTIGTARYRRQDRAVLRIASCLTAAAAAVLVGSLMIEPPDARPAPARPLAAAWETAAVIDASVKPSAQYADAGEGDAASFAQWMLEDLSGGGRR